MIRRILCALTLLIPVLVIATTTAQPALADTESGAASTAVSRLLADWNGTTFSVGDGESCPQINEGGNCWWWAANAWMALISYAEENPGSADASTIANDLSATYTGICGQWQAYQWGQCPTTADQSGKDPFTINTNGNTYFDDIGWWDQMWINAYKLTHNADYLYLAEELWNYVTVNGYAWDTNSNNNNPCGGIVQFHQVSDPTKAEIGGEDAYANALYLRNSAWLYSITGDSEYMTGSGGVGGAIYAASWIRSNLIYKYGGPAMGTPGAQFMIADHASYDPTTQTCSAAGDQSWLQSQGEMVNAWTDMYAACLAYSQCSAAPAYYNNLADELALTVVSDKLTSAGTWPDEQYSGQAEPTVDLNGILSEPCKPTSGNTWPRGCPVGTSLSDYQPYLISKGIFERAIYCSNHNFNDSVLTSFAALNAGSLAGLPNFGFLWDSQEANAPVIFPTQASVLDGLDADLGGSYAMC